MVTRPSSGPHQTLLLMPVWSLISGMLRPSVTCAGSLLGPWPDPSVARWIRTGQHHCGVHLDPSYLCLCICIPKRGHVAVWARVHGLWPTQQSKRKILGERSEEEMRLRENTHRMQWLNTIRETHMALLRENQMPSEVQMKHKLNINMSSQYGWSAYFSNKLQLIVTKAIYLLICR